MAKAELQGEVLPEGDLKRLLTQVKGGKKYSCAVVQSDDKKQSAISVDRRKKGKKLAKTLRGMDGVTPQTIRFGYVSADGSTMVLHTNKPMTPTMLQQMKPIGRRGAGFTEIINLVNEALEEESEEDAPEEADGAETAAKPAAAAAADAPKPAAPAAAAPVPPAPPAPPRPPETAAAAPAPAPAEASGTADADKARARLAALIKMVGPAAAAYPSKKAMLVELANEAKTLVLAGDDATAKLAALEAALRDIAKARAEGQAPGGAAPAASDDTAKARLAKADQIWLIARTQMRQDLDNLKKAVVDAYADNAAAQSAVRGSLSQFDSMFSWMDGRLEGKLGAALKAGSAEERRGLAHESATIAADYFKAAKSQGKIKDLDDNPFDVPTRFTETIDKLLPQLEKAMQEIA